MGKAAKKLRHAARVYVKTDAGKELLKAKRKQKAFIVLFKLNLVFNVLLIGLNAALLFLLLTR